MAFAGETGVCTSRGRSPDQAMMVCVAIVELLDGLGRFMTEKLAEYTFVGTDSSFAVHFKKGRNGTIAVSCGSTSLGDVSPSVLSKAILSGAETFVGQADQQLSKSAAVREDMFAALESFRGLVRAK
ncbi:hypothetical protein KRR26_29300 [Corallococcus sp. M34]|uniref:hypothetical protein n=1 Tax=Citreicoccus inhibens TaxID=2849499 RepID=UPI001C23E820|nr:hypothetical protein [Citreicoccus inhibens]MBU8899715.1 hypothetical protein [Citreicoccus inhibens]